ncbi:MAG: V-type ATPase 116kDa subunit family protein [Acidobacteriota bacterium]
MLRSVPMVHMQVQVPSRDAAAVTHGIAAEGLLHLVDIAHGRLSATPARDGSREALAAYRDLATRIRRTADRLTIPLSDLTGGADARAPSSFGAEREALEGGLAPIEQAVNAAWTRATEARHRLVRLEASRRQAQRLSRAGVDATRLAGLRYLTVRLGELPIEAIGEVAHLVAPAPVAVVPLDVEGGRCLAAVAAPRSAADRVDQALRVAPFEAVAASSSVVGLDEDALEAEHRATTQALAEARALLAGMTADVAPVIDELWQRVQVAVVLLQAQTHFAVSGRFVVIAGWIPEERADHLTARIAAASGGRAIVTVERPDEMPEALTDALRIPILHRNPLLIRPFERLVRLYGTPSYREVEPTAFFALSFLLMFGLMFGDVGHGATLFSAGYFLYRRIPRFLDYGILLMEAGAASTVFGALYGSVFGVHGVIPVLWMEPIRDLPRFMGIALGVGAVLISLALGLNAINAWRAGERPTAIFGLHGVFGAFVYWSLLALVVRGVMPAVRVPAWLLVALLTVAAGLLVLKRPIVAWLDRGRPPRRNGVRGPLWLAALEGSVELVDALVTFFANTVSFVRIAAFAAVHAGVFVAMFALVDTLAALRFGGVLSAVVLVAANIIAILLEGLTISVQVLRLEYYEFFGRFFRGGGEAYRPLMLRTKGES